MKQLKEDNPFYGKKGHIISDSVYNNLPSKHQALFQEINKSHTLDDYVKMMKKVERAVFLENHFEPMINIDFDDDEANDEDEDDEDFEEEDEEDDDINHEIPF